MTKFVSLLDLLRIQTLFPFQYFSAIVRERANDEAEDVDVRAFAQYALNELNAAGTSVVGRRCPPSQHEIDVSGTCSMKHVGILIE